MRINNTIPTIAFAGNPNVGKTSLFNSLTGSRQTVGNWPGVTVEHKEGMYTYEGQDYRIIDLPGIYSLSAASPDEQVSRNFILTQKPDLVVNIVDASNLERNLYLTVQLMEMQTPMILILSMMDIATSNGLEIEIPHLISHVGYPVYPLVLNKKLDISSVKASIAKSLASPAIPSKIYYDEVVEQGMSRIEDALTSIAPREPQFLRWTALKLLEGDLAITAAVSLPVQVIVAREAKAIATHRRQTVDVVIADDRYGFIRGLTKDVVHRKTLSLHTFSDRVDKVVLNSYLGLPIFFVVMYLVFLIAVRFSQPLIHLIASGLSYLLLDKLGGLISLTIVPQWLRFLVVNGLGGGIVTIGTFVPPIFFIFVSLSFLEDSGYMARAAFIADKFMRKVGLPGKAFIPLLVGFGCTVPAIMATRTLESKRDRIFASLLTPFMSCGAKLPVYTFLVMIFFPVRADLVIFALYLSGVVMGMLTALLLKKTLFKTEPGNFVMELPPYHLPTLNGILVHTWHRLKDFILRAGKTILLVIVLINILQVITIPDPFAVKGMPAQTVSRAPILEVSGKLVTPLLYPMGIKSDNWQATVALISGIFAKEAVVGTLQSLNQEPGASIEENIAARFGGWRAAFAYLLFIVLYSPCVASLAMMFKEHGTRWLIFTLAYLTALAWIVGTLFYQLTNFTSESWLWIGVSVVVSASFYLILTYSGRNTHHAIK